MMSILPYLDVKIYFSTSSKNENTPLRQCFQYVFINGSHVL